MKEKKDVGATEGSLTAVESTTPGEGCAGTAAGENTDGSGNSHGSTVQKYTKEQLTASARFRDRRDLVKALLEEGQQYTVAEADRMVREFMKGKVE